MCSRAWTEVYALERELRHVLVIWLAKQPRSTPAAGVLMLQNRHTHVCVCVYLCVCVCVCVGGCWCSPWVRLLRRYQRISICLEHRHIGLARPHAVSGLPVIVYAKRTIIKYAMPIRSKPVPTSNSSCVVEAYLYIHTYVCMYVCMYVYIYNLNILVKLVKHILYIYNILYMK